MEIKYIKSAARIINRDCVNKRSLDLSKNILWVSVGEWAADLQAVKVEGQKKNSAERPGLNPLCLQQADRQNFFSNLQL